MNEEKTFISLANPSFTFLFGDKEYQIKKANIEQVAQYQQKIVELSKDEGIIPSVKDLEITSYAVYLSLKVCDSTVTLEYVKQNLPGSVDGLSLLTQLGFIDPQKADAVKKLQEKLILNVSSQTLQTEPDGLQKK